MRKNDVKLKLRIRELSVEYPINNNPISQAPSNSSVSIMANPWTIHQSDDAETA